MKNNQVTRKQRTELLVAGETGWELWTAQEKSDSTSQQTFAREGGAFTAGGTHRVLAIPSLWVWVLPAWLKGSGDAQLRPMAALHMERLGVRISTAEHPMEASVLSEKDGASLLRMVAHREHSASLSDFSRLPDQCVLTPSLFSPPANSIAIWRELGRLVMAITQGNHLTYYSALSAPELDDHAIIEILSVCVQLKFQEVVSALSSIVLWTEEGDPENISNLTGLPVHRLPRPVPQITPACLTTVTPQDIAAARGLQAAKRKKRLVLLAMGAVGALAVAAVAGLTSLASRTRSELLDEIATLTPKATQVERHKRAWEEVAAAVDPSRSPMELLLHCMAAPSAAAVSITHFEITPERIVVRGRTATPAQALQYVQETRSLPPLAAFNLDATPPTIASDNTASFELKGTIKP